MNYLLGPAHHRENIKTNNLLGDSDHIAGGKSEF